LMSLVSASMASIGLSLLVGLGGYVLLAATLSWVPLGGTVATIASFVIPSGLKPYLLRPELGPALAACAGTLPYIALYVFLGWQVFPTRETGWTGRRSSRPSAWAATS